MAEATVAFIGCSGLDAMATLIGALLRAAAGGDYPKMGKDYKDSPPPDAMKG